LDSANLRAGHRRIRRWQIAGPCLAGAWCGLGQQRFGPWCGQRCTGRIRGPIRAGCRGDSATAAAADRFVREAAALAGAGSVRNGAKKAVEFPRASGH